MYQPSAKMKTSNLRGQQRPEYRWVNITRAADFPPRDGAGALVFDGCMFLIGGWNPCDKEYYPRTCVNDVWSSTDGATWKLEKPNTFRDERFNNQSDWEGTHTAGYVVFRGRLWLIGGDPIQGHYQNQVWNSADGRDWRLIQDRVPWAPRVLHCTFVFNDRLWVLGGQTLPQFAPEAEIFYHDLWCSADGCAWQQVEMTMPFEPQRGMIVGQLIFKNRVWLLGGGTYETPGRPQYVFYNDVWSSADGKRWTRHSAQAPWQPRVYHNVAVFDNRLWVLGGHEQSGANGNDVWYSIDGECWQELRGTPWAPRHAASVFVYKDALWVAAGSHMVNDVWKLERC